MREKSGWDQGDCGGGVEEQSSSRYILKLNLILWLCGGLLWRLYHVPLAHFWLQLCLWRSPPSPVLLLMCQWGGHAGDIITLGQPSTTRALGPQKGTSPLFFKGKILEGIPCTSQKCNLHQPPWTHPLILTCPPSLALLTLSPPAFWDYLPNKLHHSVPCFCLCFGRTQTMIWNLTTLPIPHLPPRSAPAAMVPSACPQLLRETPRIYNPRIPVSNFLPSFSEVYNQKQSFSSIPPKHPSSVPTSKVDIYSQLMKIQLKTIACIEKIIGNLS